MVSSTESLFTHNINLKIKELWLKRWKIVTILDLLSNQGEFFLKKWLIEQGGAKTSK